MSDILENPVHPNADGASIRPVWNRVGMVELNAHWGWLSVRLKERYPRATEQQMFSHLLGCTGDNECFFISNDHAIALFTIAREHLTPRFVREQFCVCDAIPDHIDFAEALYEPAGNWIRRLGIRDFHYLGFSDSGESAARREGQALQMRTERVKIMIMEDKRGS